MHYVVAAPWGETNPDLCIYTFGHEIQNGEDGQWLVDRAKFTSPERDCSVYEVVFKKLWKLLSVLIMKAIGL